MIKKQLNKQIKKILKPLDVLNKIEISKSAVLKNFEIFQKYNPDCLIFPVLKANAYGHGITQIAEIISSLPLDYICVDSYFEYLKIKDIIKCKTLILGYNKLNNLPKYNFKNVSLVIYDLDSLKALAKLNQNITIHLKIDTGMTRQGIFIEELGDFLNELKKYSKINLEGLCTHLADADNPSDDSYSKHQIQIFKNAIAIVKAAGFSPKYYHLANSAAALKFTEPEFNAIRLGLGLYGYSPLDQNDHFFYKAHYLRPCLKFKSTIIQEKLIEYNTKISYNLTFSAENEMRIGIVPVGYYEGVDRRLSNIGYFGYNSHNNRILGRVCMNMTIVELTKTPLKAGDEIEYISDHKNHINSVENIAKMCNTISYEITTKLSESVRRFIVS